MSDNKEDTAARNAAKRAAERLQDNGSRDKSQVNLSLNRDNYQALQKKLGRGNVSHAIDLMIKYLLEELSDS